MKIKNKNKIIHYDAGSDVLYFGISKGLEEDYLEVAPGIGVEFDENGKIIGIEILNASRVMRPVSKSLFSFRKTPTREQLPVR